MSTMTRIFLVLLLVASAVSLLHAQGGAYGTILGTVTDNSGAVVARANVDVTNLNTNVTKRTVTTSSGDFTLPYLEPGNYRVSVQSQGFQKSVVDNIRLVVGQEARADVILKTGAVTETVEVQATAVALDTDSSAVSQLVSEKQVDELPLNGRNFLNLLFIGAGAVQTVGEQGQMRQGDGQWNISHPPVHRPVVSRHMHGRWHQQRDHHDEKDKFSLRGAKDRPGPHRDACPAVPAVRRAAGRRADVPGGSPRVHRRLAQRTRDGHLRQ